MCIQWTRVLYSLVITWPSNLPISQSNSRVMNSRVSGQCLYTISCLLYKKGQTIYNHKLVSSKIYIPKLTVTNTKQP